MKTERRPRETNQQLNRRFNREIMLDGRLLEYKEKQYFTKPLSRNMKRKRAVRSAQIAKQYQAY